MCPIRWCIILTCHIADDVLFAHLSQVVSARPHHCKVTFFSLKLTNILWLLWNSVNITFLINLFINTYKLVLSYFILISCTFLMSFLLTGSDYPRFGQQEPIRAGSQVLLTCLQQTLSKSLPSGTKRCSELFLYISCSKPGICHFCKEHWFFFRGNGISGCWECSLLLGFSSSKPPRQQIGSTHTHAHTHTHLPIHLENYELTLLHSIT